LPWDFINYAPVQQGMLIAIMEMQIEADRRDQERFADMEGDEDDAAD